VSKTPARERLVAAAFVLFKERGYEQTTVDDIAERAGVGRTTFFRYYRSKEDVIFPDHDGLLAAVTARLDTSTGRTALVAVAEAAQLVLQHYIEEGEYARLRYALTSRIAALRDREIASVARYQRVFREFIAGQTGVAPDNALVAEVMAAAVVAAHNHVLRRWLRGDTTEPMIEIDAAMSQVVAMSAQLSSPPVDNGTYVIVVKDDRDPERVIAAVRRALRPPQPRRGDTVSRRTLSRGGNAP
jgi:AcrR family transcriptional regulator